MGGGVAVHDGHLAVHEHAVEGAVGAQFVEGFEAIDGRDHAEAGAFQQITGQFLVQGWSSTSSTLAPASCRWAFCRILLVLRTLEVGATSWPKDCARVSSKVEG